MKTQLKILYGLEATEGGAALHVSLLGQGMQKADFEVTLIHSDNREMAFGRFAEELKSARVNLIKIPMVRSVNLLKDLKAFLTVLKHLKENRYDIVHAHSSKAGMLFRVAAWIRHVPVIVYTPHTFHFQGKRGLAHRFFRFTEKILGKLSTQLIAVSHSEQKLIIQEKVINRQKLSLIPNGIALPQEPTFAANSTMRQQLGILQNEIIIGGIGRATYQKNWEQFFSIAVSLVQKRVDVKIMIIGMGKGGEQFQRLINEKGLSDRFMFIDRVDDPFPYYNVMDILLNTSRWEGLPYALLEAMSMEVPVVATAVAGNRDVVKNGENGFLFSPDEPEAALSVLEKLVADPVNRLELGKTGRKIVSTEYDLTTFWKTHARLYAGLVSSH